MDPLGGSAFSRPMNHTPPLPAPSSSPAAPARPAAASPPACAPPAAPCASARAPASRRSTGTTRRRGARPSTASAPPTSPTPRTSPFPGAADIVGDVARPRSTPASAGSCCCRAAARTAPCAPRSSCSASGAEWTIVRGRRVRPELHRGRVRRRGADGRAGAARRRRRRAVHRRRRHRRRRDRRAPRRPPRRPALRGHRSPPAHVRATPLAEIGAATGRPVALRAGHGRRAPGRRSWPPACPTEDAASSSRCSARSSTGATARSPTACSRRSAGRPGTSRTTPAGWRPPACGALSRCADLPPTQTFPPRDLVAPTTRSAGEIALGLLEGRRRDRRVAGAEEEDAGEAARSRSRRWGCGAASSPRCVIVPVRSLLTKKTAPPPSLAWLSSMIVPAMPDGEQVAVEVDRAAAAAAGRAGPGRVGAVADRRVVAEHAVEHHPRHADAAAARRRWSTRRPGPARRRTCCCTT